MRVRATVAYDGTEYRGFQRQLSEPTVQEALETALERITQTPIRVLAAGRTDAGVHAKGQVIAFDTSWQRGLSVLQRAMNAVLPPDVAVRGLQQVASDFHPRFDAQSRRYRYTVYNAPVRSPLARRSSLHVRRRLDVAAMEQAASALVGTHDFATFGRPPQGDNTVRCVLEVAWRHDPPWLFFEIEANAFLFRMVRSIVGTLLAVGRGKLSPDEFDQVLASQDRSLAGKTAPARGLCLIQVAY